MGVYDKKSGAKKRRNRNIQQFGRQLSHHLDFIFAAPSPKQHYNFPYLPYYC